MNKLRRQMSRCRLESLKFAAYACRTSQDNTHTSSHCVYVGFGSISCLLNRARTVAVPCSYQSVHKRDNDVVTLSDQNLLSGRSQLRPNPALCRHPFSARRRNHLQIVGESANLQLVVPSTLGYECMA